MKPETRMLRLELQHAIGAIERAVQLAGEPQLEADLRNLLEAAQELLALVKEKV